MGQKFDLTGFFTGNMVKAKTANINGEAKGGINFLDGGGADALKLGKPSNLAGKSGQLIVGIL